MMRTLRITALSALVAALGAQGLPASAQTAATSLGSVRIPRAVVANGQALPAGTYTLRVSSDPVGPAIGLSPQNTRWVEFVQGGQVRGKEEASVVAPADIRSVARGASPSAGATRVEMLKGNEYLRVWLNRGGTHYIVHLVVR
jgi:hypothetical protein